MRTRPSPRELVSCGRPRLGQHIVRTRPSPRSLVCSNPASCIYFWFRRAVAGLLCLFFGFRRVVDGLLRLFFGFYRFPRSRRVASGLLDLFLAFAGPLHLFFFLACCCRSSPFSFLGFAVHRFNFCFSPRGCRSFLFCFFSRIHPTSSS